MKTIRPTCLLLVPEGQHLRHGQLYRTAIKHTGQILSFDCYPLSQHFAQSDPVVNSYSENQSSDKHTFLSQTSHPPSLHWGPSIEPSVSRPETAPIVQEQQPHAVPPVMHHLPQRMRQHRPFEPFDMSLLHSHPRDALSGVQPPNPRLSETMHRRLARELPGVQSWQKKL